VQQVRSAADRASLAEEQAALRRVATLVARGAPPNEVLDAVAVEVGRLIGADLATLARYDQGGGVTVLASRPDGTARELPTANQPTIDPESLTAAVLRTGRPARIEDYGGASGPWAAQTRELGYRSAVAAPVTVEGRLWGAMIVTSTDAFASPRETEDRLAEFTELVAAAIANAESRGELAASEERARALAEEQSALRRVATLVAGAPASEQFFSTVAREVASVLNVPGVIIQRYEADGTSVTVGEAFGSDLAGAKRFFAVGSRMPPDPGSLAAQVFDTHRPARIDDFSALPGTIGDLARAAGLGSGCAGPIVVGGDLWGKMCVFSRTGIVLPVGTENRLHDFIELVATAIANYEARADLAASEARARELANEQAALRRVATLVAQGASSDELFSAVAREVAGVIGIPVVGIRRYEADGTFTVLGNAGDTPYPVGSRWPIVDEGITGLILATGRPVRKDGWTSSLPGPHDDGLPKDVWNSSVGVPIVVEGSIWGFIGGTDKSGRTLPPDTEERLARFTELVATAVSNATTRTELLASRARLVSAADETRRRLERDLHDGIQQWLVALALRARKAAGLSAASESAVEELSGLADDLVAVTDELREISRGIHPAILSDAGLDDALDALARRSAIRVDLDVSFQSRYDPTLEATVYYVAAESITNAVKHARASTVKVLGGRLNASIELEIKDDGVGGADPRRGTGLIGLKDRVETLGGTISFASPAGAGTTIRMKLPTGRRDGEHPHLPQSDEAASPPRSG
jgi:signal transduction histidine kinase